MIELLKRECAFEEPIEKMPHFRQDIVPLLLRLVCRRFRCHIRLIVLLLSPPEGKLLLYPEIFTHPFPSFHFTVSFPRPA
jgi:hypothetical protein